MATSLLRNLLSLDLASSSPFSAKTLVQDDEDVLRIKIAAVETALVAGHGRGKGKPPIDGLGATTQML